MGFDFQVPSVSLEKFSLMCVYIVQQMWRYNSPPEQLGFDIFLVIFSIWKCFQTPKPAAPCKWEGIGAKICLEHGTQLALAFLKPPGALCGCTAWYRKNQCPSSEWRLWQHRVNSPFYSQPVEIFKALEPKLTLDAVYQALHLCHIL